MFMTKKVKDHFIQQAIYESHLFFDEYHSFSQGPTLLHANHKDNVVPTMLQQQSAVSQRSFLLGILLSHL